MRPTYLSLQYLRAVAALLVVLAHTTEYPITAAGAVPGWTARTGDLGVLTFFVISGFIISIVIGRSRFDPLSFARKRFLRVVPLYWLCTVTLFVLALAAPNLFKTTSASAMHLVQSLLFIPHPAPGDGTNFWSPLLKPGWTLNFEVFFYALAASLFWCRSSFVRAVLLTCTLGGLASLKLVASAHPGVLGFYASTDLIAFVVGIWLAHISMTVSLEAHPSSVTTGLVNLAAGLSIAAVYLASDEAIVWTTLVAAATLVASGLLTERSGLLPRLAWLRSVGDASYSLYLTHMFSVGLAWGVMRKLFVLSTPGEIAAGVAASIAFSVAVSLVIYRTLERPLIALSHRGRSAPRQVDLPRHASKSAF